MMVGIIGGIGPESTVQYYRSIIASYREHKTDGSYPEIIVNSVNLREMLGYIEANDLKGVTDFLLREVVKVFRAGADFAVMASNTPHIVFDDVRLRSPIPLISIVEATCTEARSLGLKRVGLFGALYTMQARFYPDVFLKHGVEVIAPGNVDQVYIHEKYMGELVNGIVRPETREALVGIAERMREEQNIEGLILGGTELPLILTNAEEAGIPILNTSSIHVKEIVAKLLSQS